MIRNTAWRLALGVAFLLAMTGALRPLPAAAAENSAAESLLDQAAVEGPRAPIMFDARIVGDDSRVRFIADLSATVDAAVFTLADPYRIVVDMPDVRFALPALAGTEPRGLASAFRYGSISAGKSRIVIDVTGPVAVDKSFAIEPADGQPARLVIDVIPTTREAFLAATTLYRGDRGGGIEPAEPPSVFGGGDRPVIVVDPGHGGIDAGARGEGGAVEKDVVLSFAKVLGARLLATERYRIVYTRADDSFVSLPDRMKIARRHDARLFVSIHANSFSGGAIRGAIVYTASDQASDRMAAALAEAENRSDVLAGIEIDGEDAGEVEDILIDLTQRETRNFGVVFAQHLVRELSKTTRMFKIPFQQASFKVLETPGVPSALVELGYLTNRSDEELLASPEWQATTAGSIVDAIDAYFGKVRAAEAVQP
jgi:N-acetylmuramoyl-L-alanine amidase